MPYRLLDQPQRFDGIEEADELLLSVALHVAAWFLTIEDYSWTLAHPAWYRKLILLKI